MVKSGITLSEDGLPIYLQVIWQVKQMIGAGVYEAGDPLPTVLELAEELRINANTVLKAYRELEREHVVITRRGVGTFVADSSSLPPPFERERILRDRIKELLLEAKRLGKEEKDFLMFLAKYSEEIIANGKAEDENAPGELAEQLLMAAATACLKRPVSGQKVFLKAAKAKWVEARAEHKKRVDELLKTSKENKPHAET